MILTLAGGVGGARLSAGLAQCLEPERLTIIVNTGDDFVHYGLRISPDLDSVMYTLAGRNDPKQGWGLADESWRCMQTLRALGEEPWFQLGDQDLATHLLRTRWLLEGATLSEATRRLCKAFGIRHCIAPMSDQTAATRVDTDAGLLDFQDYFVRRRCEPRLLRVCHNQARLAQPSEPLMRTLGGKAPPDAIVICPSNPYLSIDPILALPGIRRALAERRSPAVAVSPIIGGKAVKGPLGKIMDEMGVSPNPLSIAHHYAGLVDGLIIDNADSMYKQQLEDTGLRVRVTDTLMIGAVQAGELARHTLGLVTEIERQVYGPTPTSSSNTQ